MIESNTLSQPSFSFPAPALLANSPLNQPLYNALIAAYGEVKITHASEPRKVAYTPDRSRGGRLSAKILQHGEQYVINCPFCGDRRRRCNVSHEYGIRDSRTKSSGWSRFHCYNEPCHTKPANWDLLRQKLQRAGYQANNFPLSRGNFATSDFPSPTAPCRLPDGLIPLHRLPRDHEAVTYLQGRGISPVEVSIRYGVCYCEENNTVEPKFDHRLVIPLFGIRSAGVLSEDKTPGSPEYELVGWQARTLAGDYCRKYLNFSGFKKSLCLYGLPEALVTPGPVVLCEGVTDAWKIGPGALALFGKIISPEQVRLLNRYFPDRSIIILLDGDARSDAHQIRKTLMASHRHLDQDLQILVASLPEGYADPGECSHQILQEFVEKTLGGSRPVLKRNQPYGVLDGNRNFIKPAVLSQMGTSMSVMYAAASNLADAEFMPTPSLALVAQNGRHHYIVRGAEKILASLSHCQRIYHDSLSARCLELREGLPAPVGFEDLSLMAHLLDENAAYDLPALAKQFLPESVNPAGNAVNPAVPAVAAAVNGASLIRQIWDEGQLPRRISEHGMEYLYRQIELPAIAPLADMMMQGVPIDATWLKKRHAECLQKAAAQEKKITALTNLAFDASEDSAVRQFIAELDLPGTQFTKSNEPVINKEALQALIGEHLAIEPLIEARRQRQLAKSATSLLENIDDTTGRIYCKLDPINCNTGRILCSEPNLQGLPADLRDAVAAGEGKSLVHADYSQFELRILTHYTQESDFVEAYTSENVDIHAQTAGIIYDKQPNEVTAAERKVGKTVNFSLVNGLTANGLARELQLSQDEAGDFIDKFFGQYSQIRTWIDEAINKAATDGFTSSLYSRRRHLPDLRSQDRWLAEKAKRQVLSGIIQATGADIFKLMLGRLYRELPPDCKIILPIHDAVLLEIPDDRVEETVSLVRRVMQETPPNFSIPLVADVQCGKRWGECSTH